MKKRLLSIALTLCIVLLFVPTTAFADIGGEEAKTNVLADTQFADVGEEGSGATWQYYLSENDGDWANIKATVTGDGAGTLDLNFTEAYGGFADAKLGVQIYQTGVTLSAGTEYILSFDVTSTGTKSIEAKFDEYEGLLDEVVQATAGTSNYCFTIPAPETDISAKFLFAAGWFEGDDSQVDIKISNLSMIPKTVSVKYLDATGTEQTCASATEVTSSDTTWSTGWYVVTGNVIIGTDETPQRVTVSGDVHLILTDGCTLTVNGGIQVQDDDNDITNGSANALTIYAQSTDKSTMGELIAKGAEDDYNAVIGGNEGNGYGGSGGAITINGGVVKATNTDGAGIGGGFGSSSGGSGGTITINGGSVIATGVNGAAIGGGYSGGGTGGDGGTIIINGGTVTATSTGYGAGIGSGSGTHGGSGGEVMITGGTVKASSSRGAGIGVGYSDSEIGNSGTFQTNNGNAVIFASSIGDQSGKTSNAWHGIIFEGDAAGIIYGESVAPTDDFTIPTGKTLTIPDGVTMTVNSRITVNGTLANNGTIIGSGSITPEEKKLTYKAAPSTPVIVSVSADSITLQPIVGETAVEYSKDNTKWQSETTFSGLTAATSYTFYARYQENGFYKGASPQSGGSAPAYTAYAAPVTNEGYSIDYAAETITVSDGYEVNTDSGFGTGTVVTSGSTVTPGQTFHVRKAASGDIPANEGTEFTIPARPAAPAAPTVKSKTSGSVTLEEIPGAQYSMDGGATWQDSPEFTGLSASTAYRFVARYGATESRFASLASAELNVTTNAALSGGGGGNHYPAYHGPVQPVLVLPPKTGDITFFGWLRALLGVD